MTVTRYTKGIKNGCVGWHSCEQIAYVFGVLMESTYTGGTAVFGPGSVGSVGKGVSSHCSTMEYISIMLAGEFDTRGFTYGLLDVADAHTSREMGSARESPRDRDLREPV